MATYKVIQDIEAEDKFLGPLTLKQFIFGAIFVVCGYISFLFLTKRLWFLVIPFLPVMFATGFLAFPWGRDQPTETWLLAKIRFIFKPRLRIWDQSGVEELVTITAPKRVEENLSDNLSQTEVKSRLKALADTIDSRGWVVKNVNVNMYTQPSYTSAPADSDRLVAASTLPQSVPAIDVRADDDILDERNNPVAQHLEQMITASTQEHRQEVLEHMQEIREKQASQTPGEQSDATVTPGQNLWFMEEPAQPPAAQGHTTFSAQNIPAADQVLASAKDELSAEEKALLEQVHKEQQEEVPATYSHMRVLQPLDKQKRPFAGAPKKVIPTVTVAPDIFGLARNNDRNVASLAREANQGLKKEPPKDEVVISLR